MTPARAAQLLLLRDSTPSTIISGNVYAHMTEDERKFVLRLVMEEDPARSASEWVEAIANGDILQIVDGTPTRG
jgi:hypothetical protein